MNDHDRHQRKAQANMLSRKIEKHFNRRSKETGAVKECLSQNYLR